jgi:hypothetical protein
MKRHEWRMADRSGLVRVAGCAALSWAAVAIFALAMAAGARAQAAPPQKNAPPPPPPGSFHPRPGPMRGIFSFVAPLSAMNAKVVKGAPFSADVVRETIQVLADGNRIDRKSTGMFARDSQGRTRREMTLANIGPWTAAGKPPHLVFIDDPVAGKIYTLDENRKTAFEMPPPPKWKTVLRRDRRNRFWSRFRKEVRIESLGVKTMEGLQVKGMRTVRTIPAGQIGNEMPIVITTERWYSPRLQTTILLKRVDPRFGTTVFRLTHIRLSNPPESLFVVPAGYTVEQRPPFRRRMARRRGHRPPDFP